MESGGTCRPLCQSLMAARVHHAASVSLLSHPCTPLCSRAPLCSCPPCVDSSHSSPFAFLCAHSQLHSCAHSRLLSSILDCSRAPILDCSSILDCSRAPIDCSRAPMCSCAPLAYSSRAPWLLVCTPVHLCSEDRMALPCALLCTSALVLWSAEGAQEHNAPVPVGLQDRLAPLVSYGVWRTRAPLSAALMRPLASSRALRSVSAVPSLRE